jgi:hypothetical protein
MSARNKNTTPETALSREELLALPALVRQLNRDLKHGDLDVSARYLRMSPPRVAHKALHYMGTGYVRQLMALPKARYAHKRGPEAVDAFLRDVVIPAVKNTAVSIIDDTDYAARKRTLLKTVSKFALSTALGLAALGASTPAFSPAAPDETDTYNYVGTDQEMAPLRTEFARTPLGRDILRFTDANGIKLVYDHDGALKKVGNYATYYEKTMTLRPDLTTDEQIVILSHELRHAFQDIRLGYPQMEDNLLRPAQAWVLRRTIEADAFAFSAYFLADRMDRLGKIEKTPNIEDEWSMAQPMVQAFKQKGSVTAEDFRDMALAPAYRRVDAAPSYAKSHLVLATRMTDVVDTSLDIAVAELGKNQTQDAWANLEYAANLIKTTPTDDEFAAYIRRYGAPAFNTDARTALQVTPLATLFNAYAHQPGAAKNFTFPMIAIEKESVADTIETETRLFDTFNARVAAIYSAAPALMMKSYVPAPHADTAASSVRVPFLPKKPGK